MDYHTLTREQLKSELESRGIQTSKLHPSARTGKPVRVWLSPAEMAQRLADHDGGLPVPMRGGRKTSSAATASAPAAASAAPKQAGAPASANDSPAGSTAERAPLAASAKAVQIATRTAKFLTDANITLQPRLLNTLAHKTTAADVAAHMLCYAELSGCQYAEELAEKLRSPEGKSVCDALAQYPAPATAPINGRLEIYYGPAGSGKTTRAVRDNPGAEVVLCHQGLTPDELFRGFTFRDGKPAFEDCPLSRAMREGRPVVLDEINLLSLDCLRAMQAITDGKSEVVIGTERIRIANGFRIIGTMNLDINGVRSPLPQPLVDRAGVIVNMVADYAAVAAIAL